jgi:hypothetical protein
MNHVINQETELKIPVSVYSRCCGYFSPVYLPTGRGTWNNAKMQEFEERKVLKIPETIYRASTRNFNTRGE